MLWNRQAKHPHHLTWQCKGQFPLDTFSLCYASATPAELRGFSLVNVLIPTSSAALRICTVPAPEPSGTDTQDFYFWWMPEHDAAIQLNLAPSRQEVRRVNNKNNIRLLFKMNHSLLTPAHTSQKKRQTRALQLVLQSGTLHAVVFNNTDL